LLVLTDLTQEQARIAESRRLAAQASEKKANDARDQADGLINFMLYDLRDKLEPIGRLDVLNDVAKKHHARVARGRFFQFLLSTARDDDPVAQRVKGFC
jgi:hypothetical protein